MAGNVAEWTLEHGSTFVARGGSYRSKVARQLKSWAFEAGKKPGPDIGFRCAYDIGTDEATSDE